MTKIFKPNKHKYKVLTPDGFQDFAGVAMMGKKPIVRLEFEKGVFVECSYNHKFYIDLQNFKLANELNIGDTVYSSEGDLAITNKIDLGYSEELYDLIEVANGHRYFTNKILSSNCEFLIWDETLINASWLLDNEGVEPKKLAGQTRWYADIKPGGMYLVALDPSLGTGGDYGAIQIFEMPSMIQVGEWRHNLTSVQGQVRTLRDILKYIHEEATAKGQAPQIYYSIENNTVGEAALIVIEHIGEEMFHGLFLSEPVRKGHVRKFRKGFNTTHGTKITACSQLKNFLETGKMKIHSKPLFSELKNYVATGLSFAAKPDETDDLVSSCLLICRMARVLGDWDPKIYDKIQERISEEEMPMPIFISGGF